METKKQWSDDEVNCLEAAVKDGRPGMDEGWQKIVVANPYLGKRTGVSLGNKWKDLVTRNGVPQAKLVSSKKGGRIDRWSNEKDACVTEGVLKFGKEKWKKIIEEYG